MASKKVVLPAGMLRLRGASDDEWASFDPLIQTIGILKYGAKIDRSSGSVTQRIVYVRPSTSVSPVDGNRNAVVCLEGTRSADEPRSGLLLQPSARSKSVNECNAPIRTRAPSAEYVNRPGGLTDRAYAAAR